MGREYNPGGKATEGSQTLLQEQAWVLGFLSGVGFVGDNGNNPLDGVDAYGVCGWIDNYCRANPIEMIAKAAAAFYFDHPHRWVSCKAVKKAPRKLAGP
jgi:hypothetical protein